MARFVVLRLDVTVAGSPMHPVPGTQSGISSSTFSYVLWFLLGTSRQRFLCIKQPAVVVCLSLERFGVATTALAKTKETTQECILDEGQKGRNSLWDIEALHPICHYQDA